MGVKVQYSFFSHQGCVRENNEDALLVHKKLVCDGNNTVIECNSLEGEKFLFAVADGVGGEQYGEIVSKMVLTRLLQNNDHLFSFEDLKTEIIEIEKELTLLSTDTIISNQSSSTIAGLLIVKDTVMAFNVGDSRVYRLNNGFFEKISHDHSIVQTLFDQGMIDEDEMRYHPQKNIITSSISADSNKKSLDIYHQIKKIREFDIFFICSDGIWETLSLDEIEEIWNETNSLDFSQKILNASFEKKARDNISLILILCQRV